MLPYMTAKTPEIVKGVVVGISNRGIDTLIKMLNVCFSCIACTYFYCYLMLYSMKKALKCFDKFSCIIH